MIAVLCLASRAPAEPRNFVSFKLVRQQPALHENHTLHDRMRPLRDKVAACGQPIEGKPPLFPTMKMHVSRDGAIRDVVIENNKNLGDDTVACIREVVGAISYPARKQPSVLTWVLVYDR